MRVVCGRLLLVDVASTISLGRVCVTCQSCTFDIEQRRHSHARLSETIMRHMMYITMFDCIMRSACDWHAIESAHDDHHVERMEKGWGGVATSQDANNDGVLSTE